jgi:hypothetical protein
MYANDSKDRIWETGGAPGQPTPTTPYRFWYAQPQNPRLASSTTNPVVLGPAFNYLSLVDHVFECPTNKRKARTTFQGNAGDPYWQTGQNALQLVLWNSFLSERSLNFDYTMIPGAAGGRVSSNIFCAWDQNCRNRTPPTSRSLALVNPTSFKRMQGIPVFAEEDAQWNNAGVPDGLFSNSDQLAARHQKKGHFVYLDCSVELFAGSHGPDPTVNTDPGDFTGNDIYVSRNGMNWFQLAPTWPGTDRPYGWIDQPR